MLNAEQAAALRGRAAELDRADPLAGFRSEFVEAEGVLAYLDGNSLGRPLRATEARLRELVQVSWGKRLIRAWDEGWMQLPTELGDLIARTVLGAGPGQTVVADSTTVLLYKLARAAIDAQPGRSVIVADTRNFPTDRFIAQGIAQERDLELRWLTPPADGGVEPEQLAAALDEHVALVLLSHVAFRSGHLADMAAITAACHEAGALTLWDLSHSAGAVELALDRDGVDLAVGCSYKYLNGGPGSPAYAFIAARLTERLRQPIQGWIGAHEPFAMAETYTPAAGMARFLSGTPPVLAMQPMRDMLELIERAGMPAIRRKSLALSDFVLAFWEEHLSPRGVRLGSPRAPERRGSHVTLEHPVFARMIGELWQRGVIPDFRGPDGLRVGLSPLSTSFAEVAEGLLVVESLLP